MNDQERLAKLRVEISTAYHILDKALVDLENSLNKVRDRLKKANGIIGSELVEELEQEGGN